MESNMSDLDKSNEPATGRELAYYATMIEGTIFWAVGMLLSILAPEKYWPDMAAMFFGAVALFTIARAIIYDGYCHKFWNGVFNLT